MNLWNTYRAALEEYQDNPTDAGASRLISAYSAWCQDFVPEHAEKLVGELRARLEKARAA